MPEEMHAFALPSIVPSADRQSKTIAGPDLQRKKHKCAQKRSRSVSVACMTRTKAVVNPSDSAHESILTCSPLTSLQFGTWFKLICGASSHDAPAISNLCAVYTAVGADCIDVACDYAIVRAARNGISKGLAHRSSPHVPLLMVSINAGADPHFRKAEFESASCPSGCPRPCEAICPADAIDLTGVIADRCYGCGRCIHVCPPDIIQTLNYHYDAQFVSNVLQEVDAVEVHVRRNQNEEFHGLWEQIGDAASRLKVVAVSLPDLGDDEALASGLTSMWNSMRSRMTQAKHSPRLIWQADGRPMSGDIGRGTAKAAVSLGKRMRRVLIKLGLPGEVQLAGGTNDATVPLMNKSGLRRIPGAPVGETVAGIAVGGYARKVSGLRMSLRCVSFLVPEG